MKRFALSLLLLFVLALPFGARAQSVPAPEIDVDLELVLAVDISRSMSVNELEIQRRGYAEALSSPDVVDAITRGINGQIAIAYIEWAGRHTQRVIVDWVLIRNLADARALAATLTAKFESGMRMTSISGALTFSAALFENNGYRGLRRVIDISGDGPNNDGAPVLPARQAVIDQGIVINGLPLMTREGKGSFWDLKDLDQYYLHCVVGGPGAFVVPVYEWDFFPQAVRRKLVLELAMPALPPPPPRIIRAQAAAPGYDCLAGEKIWDKITAPPQSR